MYRWWRKKWENIVFEVILAALILSAIVIPVFANENENGDLKGNYKGEEIALIDEEMQVTNPEFDISEGEIVMI